MPPTSALKTMRIYRSGGRGTVRSYRRAARDSGLIYSDASSNLAASEQADTSEKSSQCKATMTAGGHRPRENDRQPSSGCDGSLVLPWINLNMPAARLASPGFPPLLRSPLQERKNLQG